MSADTSLERSRAFSTRILHLLDGLRTADDIGPAQVGRAFGRDVEFDREDARVFGFGEPIDARWIGNVIALRDPERGGEPNRLLIAFDDQQGAHDDWSAVCGMEFGEFADRLAAAGYTSSPILGPRDAFSGFRFRRGPFAVDLQLRAESAAHPDRLCVARVLIDSVEARHAHA